MKEPANKNNSEEPSSHSPPVKPVMKDSTRRALAFIILCCLHCSYFIYWAWISVWTTSRPLLSPIIFLVLVGHLKSISRAHKLSSRIMAPNAIKEKTKAIKQIWHSLVGIFFPFLFYRWTELQALQYYQEGYFTFLHLNFLNVYGIT